MFHSGLIKLLRIPNTLSFRLTIWYTSAFVVFLLAAFVLLYLSIDHILDGRINAELVEEIKEYKLLTGDGRTKIVTEMNREMKSDLDGGYFIRYLDRAGNIIYNSDLSKWKYSETDIEIFNNAFSSKFKFSLHTVHYPDREYATRIIYGVLDNNSVLQLGETLEPKTEIMNLLILGFSIMFCLVIPVSAGIGWLLAKKAVSGILEVSKAAIDIENGELDRRVNVSNQRDEIQTLADTFNAMASRIRTLISEMREMTDNIAHDLRSPLARIRAISESTLSRAQSIDDYKQASGDTLEECDRLIHLINTTLDVAEAEAGVTQTKNEIMDISQLTEDACDLFGPLAEEKYIKFSSRVDPGCFFYGNKQNIQRMLANLIDNALKFTPLKGCIDVQLTPLKSKDGLNSIKISVADTGMGIPVEEQQRIFERFYRCDQSRTKPGCGLGLSFVRAVIRAHSGTIDLKSVHKKSSIFTVLMPIPSSN